MSDGKEDFWKTYFVNTTSFFHMDIETCSALGRRKGERALSPWSLKFDIFRLNFWQKNVVS